MSSVNPSNQPLSDCHQSPTRVNTADEGTSCYICTQCNQICDQYVGRQTEPNQTQVNYPGNAAAHQRDTEGLQQNTPVKESIAPIISPTTDSSIPDVQAEVELRDQIAELITDELIDDYVDYWPDTKPWADKILALLQADKAAVVVEAEDRGFKEGQRVGQYQAADKLYRHITSIYMFRDGDKKATAIAASNATDLLKDCEKYQNHNAKVYHEYLHSDRYRRFHPEAARLQPPTAGEVQNNDK